MEERFLEYLEMLKGDFTKIARLSFLNPNGTTAFVVDNNLANKNAYAFLQNGTISCNLQNGKRRQATVQLSNVDGRFDYAVNKLWFGQQVKLEEGLILSDGTEFYITQGIFELETPKEEIKPNEKTITYNLADKWSNLDGTLLGNLEDVYKVEAGTKIFDAIASILKLGRYDASNGSAYPIDEKAPIFTSYYNDKVQTLDDGTTVSLITAPYDYVSDASGTYADVILGLVEMLAAWVGYNRVGRLTVTPSDDDITDADKPIDWDFSMDEKQLVDIAYTHKNTEVYNDIIVVGSALNEKSDAIPRGRAQDTDPASETSINRIGLKTKRIEKTNYFSDEVCQSYADFMLKRYSILQKSVTVSCSQMFHINENDVITIKRTDKEGSPVEKHVVQSFSRPIGQKGHMTIEAVSVKDISRNIR